MANDEIVDHHSEEEIKIVNKIGDQVPINDGAENIDKANELSSRIGAKLLALSPILASARKMFTVHELLRNVNAKAYEPRILAIGPYHRRKNQLSATEEHKLRYLNQLSEMEEHKLRYVNQLSEMEEHKLRYLEQLLKREEETNTKKYVSVMWKLKGKARDCYGSDFVHLKDDEFVEMMLLDACFIVELLRKYTGRIRSEIGDPILKGGWMIFNVARDLLLVENQLPFFVLQEFFDMTKMSNEKSLHSMILSFFNRFESMTAGTGPKDECYLIPSADHLLGLLHWNWTYHHSVRESVDVKDENNYGFICSKLDSCIKLSKVIGKRFHLPSNSESGNATEENNRRFVCCWFHWSSVKDNNLVSKIHNWSLKWFYYLFSKFYSRNLTGEHDGSISIGCATQLKEAGIKFKKVKSDNLFAVEFKDGMMKIPTLKISDFSESFFRNLIAYEQCYQDMYYVSDYIRLMDCLVNTAKDVELLCQCEIIDNWLGDNEVVANMFNKLCDNIMFSSSGEYHKIFQEVEQHFYRRWNKWKANLRHNYFNTPWALISFLAAVSLLLLTVAQTVFSVLAYIKPK